MERGLMVAAIVAVLVSPGTARADESVERAKRHSAQGKRLFDLGLFEQAAQEYRKAYEAKAVPDLLYNLAQCHMRFPADTPQARVRALELAVHYFQGFRANAPQSPIRDHVEKEIARIAKEIEALKQQRPRPRPFYKAWWFWTGVGVVVAGATVATAVALRPEGPVVGTADPGIFYLPK